MPLVRPPFTPGTWRGKLPKIVWGPADDFTILIAMPLEEVNPFAVSREGQDIAHGRDSAMDGWRVGWDQRLEFAVRHVPASDETVDGTTATGWWTVPNGWDAWLTTWAWNRYPSKFYPDALGGTFWSVYHVAPMNDAPDVGFNFAYRPKFTLASVDGSPFTGW